MDEPGYMVSAITPDGFLRVQRLPQTAPNAVFDLLHAVQPVWVVTRSGEKVPGVFAGLSVHLQPVRQNAPKMNHPDEMYVDIGASSAEAVRAAGVDLLDPVALNRSVHGVGPYEVAAAAVGDYFGCVVLADLLAGLRASNSKPSGTLTVAFVPQQWTGGRGLDRLLVELHPDELIFVGRLMPPQGSASTPVAGRRAIPGSGVLLGVDDASAPLAGLAAELKKLADDNHLSVSTEAASPPRIAGYGATSALPQRFAQVGVATLFPVTPAETIRLKDLPTLSELLYRYAAGTAPASRAGGTVDSPGASGQPLIGELVEAYGASGHEEAVRAIVQGLLPKGVKTETDAAGNLILHLGGSKPGAKTPRIVFIAHIDEIGYQVRSIEPDGRLLVDALGGEFTEYFLGHAVLVHTAQKRIGGVLELPVGWDQTGFEWPHAARGMDDPAHVYVGTKSAEETQKLGIQPGDRVTIPKKYRPLYGTRANGAAALTIASAALRSSKRRASLGRNLAGVTSRLSGPPRKKSA